MDEQHFENKLMRIIATLFILLFCSFMFYKFLFD
jgi:hypothetical protein